MEGMHVVACGSCERWKGRGKGEGEKGDASENV